MSSPSGSLDAVELLKSDHRLVANLFSQIQGTRDRETRKSLFTKVAEELSAHDSVEEHVMHFAMFISCNDNIPLNPVINVHCAQVLYPTLRRLRQTDFPADRSHPEMKETLERLRHLDVLDPQFDANFNKLVLSVNQRVQEEENQIFPELR